MSATLKFDVSEIRKMQEKVKETAKELDELQTKIVQAIEELRESWKTTAGENFMNTVDTDWSQQVGKYISILGAVEELLETAATEYEAVENASKEISF